jgi:hypothetical protein
MPLGQYMYLYPENHEIYNFGKGTLARFKNLFRFNLVSIALKEVFFFKKCFLHKHYAYQVWALLGGGSEPLL